MGSGRNSNSYKLLWLSLLPARMMKIYSIMKALECSQHFSHYKSMEILSDVQGQLTPQTLAQSCRISNPSKLLLLSLLPAWMKNVQWKMEELECSQEFPNYNPMGAICYHGNQSSDLTWPKPNAANPPPKWCFRWNLIMIGHLVSEIFMSESVIGPTDARTNGRRLESHPISSPRAFGSGEIKTRGSRWPLIAPIWDRYIQGKLAALPGSHVFDRSNLVCPLFSLENMVYFPTKVGLSSVRLSVRQRVRSSVTFLVNVSPP